MSDISDIASDAVETVKTAVASEVKAMAGSARAQILPKIVGKADEGQRIEALKIKEKIGRQKRLDQTLAQLRQLRKTNQISAPDPKLQLPAAKIPQLKRTAGWQIEVDRHRQEVGVSKGKG